MRRLIGLWFAWLVLIAGVNLASPLYHVYALSSSLLFAKIGAHTVRAHRETGT